MGQWSNDAAAKDAAIKPSKEDCVLSTEQRPNARYAAVKDARIKS